MTPAVHRGRLALAAIAAVAVVASSPFVVERVHFVEYGLIAWLFYRAWRPLDNGLVLAWALLAGVLTGIADEFLQWVIPGRVGEAHAVFLDSAAVACGLGVAIVADPPARFGVTLERSAIRPIAYGVSTVLLVFATFVQVVHLGHQVYEPDIGVFSSRYTAPELAALSVERAARWRVQPPLILRRISREDQYLGEGFWHVQARNLAWSADDPFTAWRENRILEIFFAPVLDTSSYASLMPPRWPAQQREQTAARVAGDPGIYISRAAPYPILTWSPMAFWSAVVVIVAAVMSAC